MDQKWIPNDLARWLRRRRKIRSVRAGGPAASYGDPDFYDPDGDYIPDDLPRMGCLIIIILLAILIFGSCWAFFGDGDAEIIGSPLPPVSSSPSSASSSSSSSAGSDSSAGTPAPPVTQRPLIGDAALDELLDAIGLGGLDQEAQSEIKDGLQDLIDSLRGVIPPYQGRDVDIVRALAFLVEVDEPFQVNAFGNTVYPCSDANPLVVCANEVLEMEAGELLVIAVQMDDDVPTASTERSYVYSIVFDSDGDAANDWVFNLPFDWDYFQGADLWFQATYNTGGLWFVDVTQLTADGSFPASSTASAVRVVVDGPWMVWFFPTSEFAVYPAPFRVTAFAHDGFFSESSRGGDVMGADPTEPLTVPPTSPAFISIAE